MNRIDIKTSIILGVGMVCITVAYVWGPAEYRDEIIATVGGLAAMAAAGGNKLVRSK